jgi:hypothetical protein
MRNIFIVIMLFISISAHAFDNEDADKSGDVLRILLPVAAFSTTLLKNDKEGGIQFGESFLINAGSTYMLKESIKKDRPDNSGDDAFPSGHASMSFQAATFLQKRYGYEYGIPAYLTAAYTSWTRLAADEHDEADILAGALLGTASAYFLTDRFDGVSIVPYWDRKTAGITFSFRLP